ncbi:hypothetical protein D9611_006476 [Ephemerocybe angulata]|uniref:Uncharacterized protein n=1 Tax=Ephemerocybe angulata TaxID=980116 RepID=A0A8H5C712_9AGAR|nr:hypothetical protein D9611_006476 [Tulosesus angulatus]
MSYSPSSLHRISSPALLVTALSSLPPPPPSSPSFNAACGVHRMVAGRVLVVVVVVSQRNLEVGALAVFRIPGVVEVRLSSHCAQWAVFRKNSLPPPPSRCRRRRAKHRTLRLGWVLVAVHGWAKDCQGLWRTVMDCWPGTRAQHAGVEEVDARSSASSFWLGVDVVVDAVLLNGARY